MIQKNKILILEEQSILRAGLCTLLRLETDLDVIGEAVTGAAVVDMIDRHQPDLIMLDITLRGSNGIGIVAEIRQHDSHCPILVLTQQKSEDSIRGALRDGANGYVLKDASDAELIMAVRTALSGKIYLSPSISEKVINMFLVGNRNSPQSRWETLTGREREILKMIAEGYTSKYIANTLGLSIKTIEKHRSNLMKKLDMHNVSALTTFAIGQGLIVTE